MSVQPHAFKPQKTKYMVEVSWYHSFLLAYHVHQDTKMHAVDIRAVMIRKFASAYRAQIQKILRSKRDVYTFADAAGAH